MWKKFKETLISTATKVCGYITKNNHRKQTPWWTEQVRKEVKKKKLTWQKYLREKNDENYNEYKKQRKCVKQLIQEMKRNSWVEFGRKMEKDSRGNQKLFYKVLKTMRSERRNEDIYIKDSQGNLLKEESQIMDRWREYFRELLQATQQDERLQEIEEMQKRRNNNDTGEKGSEEIQMEEVERAIGWLKRGKAPGWDKITSEMIMTMGDKAMRMLLKIYQKAWEEEQIPKDWEVGLILPIYKKGDTRKCDNYRGITLLGTALKIYEKIIDTRLRTEIEDTLNETQSGFRRGRSTQDHVFTIKQVINKTKLQGNKAFLTFIDLEKAFDRVPRRRVWESLRERDVSGKIIRVIKSLYRRNINYVVSRNMRSEGFQTMEGLRQGGALSPILFNIFMDDIIGQCMERTRGVHVGYKNLQKVMVSTAAFADDIVIMAQNEREMQRDIEVWNTAMKNREMKINKEKTKVMAINNKEQVNITIDGVKLQQVEVFVYLGIAIENTETEDIEINRRIENAQKLYYAMNKSFINKKEITRETKINVFKAIYRPILTYGCESWNLTQRQRSRLQAAEMKYLRRVRGVTRRDRIRNTEIRKDLNVKPMAEFIEERQLGWWGHLQRMEGTRQVKRVWEAKIVKKKRRGRPRKTWDGAVGEILERKGTTWREARTRAASRKDWGEFVHG